MIERKDLIEIANLAYGQDDVISNIYKQCVMGDRDPDDFGDTLATFAVRELLDVFDEGVDSEANLESAMDAMDRAARDLTGIARKFENEINQLSNRRITATMLAALRAWQMTIEKIPDVSIKEIMPDHFAGIEPLSVEEIDQLCEEINCGDNPTMRFC